MPEEQTASEIHLNQSQVEEFPTLQKKKSNKWLWVLIALIALVLVGVGIWLVTKKPATQTSEESAKQATTAAKPKGKETKPERTKFAYTDKGNIWVFDVNSKRKMQITTNGGSEVSYGLPLFVDANKLTFIKSKEVSSNPPATYSQEIWLVEVEDNKFTLDQVKKLPKASSFYGYDADSDLKHLAYIDEANNEVKLHLYNLVQTTDKVLYIKPPFGRGGTQEDAFYTKISPDASKVLLVDTILGSTDIKILGGGSIKLAATYESLTQPKIIVWDVSGKKLSTIAGAVTEPIWMTDNKSIIYRDRKDGILRFDISSKATTRLSSDTDWSGVRLSPDGQRIAHNKGFNSNESYLSDSELNVFDLKTKTDISLGGSLAFPEWINNNYLAAKRLAKCEDQDNACVAPGSYKTTAWVIINADTKSLYNIP